jgi:prepilin-type N-terminal cleavage/methylation domain-containing protein
MRPQRGFTLIELLVVLAIIGLLSSVMLASFNTARTRGQDAARISDVKSLETALDLYNLDYGGYPTSNSTGNGDVPLNDPILTAALVPKYITSMPALLIADNDHYFTGNVTTGVYTAYDLHIYVGNSNSWCRAGMMPYSTGDWGVATVCNF